MKLKTLAIAMMGFSSLVALLLVISAFFLVQIFLGSTHESDHPIGFVMGTGVLVYCAAAVFFVQRSYRAQRFAAAAVFLAIWNVVGLLGIMLLLGGISAGSQA